MAKSAPKKDQPLNVRVNLLHPQGEPLQITGKFLRWLLGYGRFIVILIEIVVILCFLYRFKLDADLERINQDIKTEAQNIESKKNDEILVRQTQQKIQLVKQTYANSPDWPNLVGTITSKVPAGVTFHSLAVEHLQNSKSLQFKIAAETKSTSDVTAFVNGLKELNLDEKDRKFKDLSLSNITFDTGVISFAVTGTTK